MKNLTKYITLSFIAFIFFVLIKNDFQLWKLFGSEKKQIVYTKGKLCTYSTRYFIGFEMNRDTTCVVTNN
jgi:hypothetical protein